MFGGLRQLLSGLAVFLPVHSGSGVRCFKNPWNALWEFLARLGGGGFLVCKESSTMYQQAQALQPAGSCRILV